MTANADRTRDMVLNSLGIVTLLKPVLGYELCAEIAREGYREQQVPAPDRGRRNSRLITPERWNEIFSFENLINPKFEQ